jgi:hypothetical protein
MRRLLIPVLFLFLVSCGDPAGSTVSDTASHETGTNPAKRKPQNVSITRTQVGSSGFFIDLPSSHRIETHQNAGFTVVYYITPFDTAINSGEAGMYFGPNPDVKPPSIDYTENMIDTVFLGKRQKWVEYVTAKYTQRETFIDQGNDQYIHCWCYSNDIDELNRLFMMMLSLQQGK